MRREVIWVTVAATGIVSILGATALKDTGNMPSTCVALGIIGGVGLLIGIVGFMTDIMNGE